MARPSWHEYFFTVAEQIAKRSTCTHAHMGAVYVSQDNDLLATGYNGSPRGLPHCIDEGCDADEKNFCQRIIHAEVNGVVQAARKGISLSGCNVYINAFPCYNCFKVMANVGVRTIYYGYKYKPEKYGSQYEKVERLARLIPIQLVSKEDAIGCLSLTGEKP